MAPQRSYQDLDDDDDANPPRNSPGPNRQDYGAQQMAAMSAHMTKFNQFGLLCSIFLLACAYTLCNILASVYEPTATASFQNHSFFVTISTIHAAVSLGAMTTVGRLTDLVGRPAIVVASLALMPLGLVIQATANNVIPFAVGVALYQLGLTCIILAIYIIIADITSLRSRVFCYYIPALPALINTWTAGNISSVVLKNTTWRWGIGMWALIYPVAAMPFLCCLWAGLRRVRRASAAPSPPKPRTSEPRGGSWPFLVSLFWQLDTVGNLLLIAALNLILLPLCSARRASWNSPGIIAPLVFGVLTLLVWVRWEMRCKQPLVPFKLLKDRAIWPAFLMALLFDTSHALQGSFLYTHLVVALGESVMSATRITALYKFVIALMGSLIGLAAYFKLRRLKLLIIVGNVLFTVGFGVLAYVRGSVSLSSHINIIVSQVFLGIGGSMFVYPIQVNVQAACRRENVAAVMSLFFCCNCMGIALGNAIAGTIWNQLLPGLLNDALGNSGEAQSAFADPFTFAKSHPLGTSERDAVAMSYAQVQRVICLVGVGTAALQVVFALIIRGPKLGEWRDASGVRTD
ncbi:MFS general substrate transporter [Podospora aff. communis PSN243]|uniref:MFS general substrate transporter n=1 Tax=Podospora aff. communis PSN243 TaxID=3040156 RepID=A0AAV9GA91_9PEZI|nr:MFS general substrate transporter [Podospora aff. communis PSN243]